MTYSKPLFSSLIILLIYFFSFILHSNHVPPLNPPPALPFISHQELPFTPPNRLVLYGGVKKVKHIVLR